MEYIISFFLALTSVADASTGRLLTLRGYLVKVDKTDAIIKDEKGPMKVPAAVIDTKHINVGQWISVNVDFVDFYRMNPEKFKDLGQASKAK